MFKNHSRRPTVFLSLFLSLVLCLNLFSPVVLMAGADAQDSLDPTEVLSATLSYLSDNITTPGVDSVGGEWAVIALARGDKATIAFKDAYLEAAGNYSSSNILDLERISLALSALNEDGSAYLPSYDQVSGYNINATIYGLLALNAKPYSGEQEEFLAGLLAEEISGGGWRLSNSGSGDVDITAMAIQALAPYYDQHSEVAEAVDRGVAWLQTQRQPNGGFVSSDAQSNSTESIAQVIVALCSIGENSYQSVAALLENYNSAGWFGKDNNSVYNAMSTEQGAYALVAYERWLKGKNALYDMSDAKDTIFVTGSGGGNNGGVSGTTETLSLTISYQENDQGFVIPRQSFTVSSDLSEKYGYSDVFGGAKVSVLDAIIQAHIAVLGEDKSVVNANLSLSSGSYGSFISNFMGDRAGNMLYYLNGANALVGASDQQMTTGDLVELYAVRDTMGWSDTYGYFVTDGQTIDAFSIKQNQELKLNLHGSSWDGEAPVANASLKQLVSVNGKWVFEDLGVVTGADGSATLNFSQTGTYIISAVEEAGGTPLLAPYMTLTVTTAGGNNSSGSSSKITVTFSLTGDTKHYVSAQEPGKHSPQTWISPHTVSVSANSSVKEVTESELKAAGIDFITVSNGTYLKSVNGLAEMDNGPNSGWIYKVNGTICDESYSDYKLKSGDLVEWYFTDNYSKDDLNSGGEDSASDSNESAGTSTNTTDTTDGTSSSTEESGGLVGTGSGVLFLPESWVNPYQDVNSEAWYYGAVAYVSSNGLMQGLDKGFGPYNPLTKYMLLAVLARANGVDANGEKWQEKALEWGKANNLTDGSKPGGNLTREELVTIIWRYAGSPESLGALNIVDEHLVSPWAKDAAAWALENKICSGYPDNTFRPQNDITRAESAAIITRYLTQK